MIRANPEIGYESTQLAGSTRLDLAKHDQIVRAIEGLEEAVNLYGNLAQRINGPGLQETERNPTPPIPPTCLAEVLIRAPELIEELSERLRHIYRELEGALF